MTELDSGNVLIGYRFTAFLDTSGVVRIFNSDPGRQCQQTQPALSFQQKLSEILSRFVLNFIQYRLQSNLLLLLALTFRLPSNGIEQSRLSPTTSPHFPALTHAHSSTSTKRPRRSTELLPGRISSLPTGNFAVQATAIASCPPSTPSSNSTRDEWRPEGYREAPTF